MDMRNFKKPGIFVACIILLIAVLTPVLTHKETIDLAEYADVKFEGYDGYGEASLEWDEEKLYKKLGEILEVDADKIEDAVQKHVTSYRKELTESNFDFDDDSELDDIFEIIYDIFWGSKLAKDSKLKNGDTVTVHFKYDNEDAGKLGIKFKGEKAEYQVSGLEVAKTVNPFDYLEVSYEGISPIGTIILKKKDSGEKVMETVNFEADKTQELKIGDKVAVTAKTWADEQQLSTMYGSTLSETTKEFTVEGIAEYISDAEELEGDDLFARLKSQTESVIKAYFAEEQSSISAGDLKYEGYYFLDAKEVNYYEYNKIEMVYSATIKSKDKYNKFEPTKVYFPIEFKNIIKDTDGKMTADLNAYTRKGGITLGYKWMNAYTDITSMKNALVVTEGAKFDCTYGGVLQ